MNEGQAAEAAEADGRRKVGAAEAAAMWGIKKSTWRVTLRNGHAPPPDGYEEVSGQRWWYVDTIRNYVRPGRGKGRRKRRDAE